MTITRDSEPSENQRLLPRGILCVLHKHWSWALGAFLLTLPLGVLPLMQSTRYSATLTISGFNDYDTFELFRPGSLTRRGPLAEQIAQGTIDVAVVASEAEEQVFALTGTDPAAVELAQDRMASLAMEMEQSDRERSRAEQAASNEYLAMQVDNYERLRTLLLSSLKEATTSGHGDLPSTILSITRLLLPLKNELSEGRSKEAINEPRIVTSRSAVTAGPSPSRWLVIGMIGVALSIGLLAAIVADALIRVRKALSAQ